MSKDWIAEQLQDEQRRDEEVWADVRKAQLAQAGAPRLFDEISTQVQDDLDQYRLRKGRKLVEYSSPAPRAFAVRCSRYPVITLEVSLNDTTIEYRYWKKPDDTAPGRWDRKVQLLRITAGLEGSVQASQGGVVFVDAGEISAALLKPLLDYDGR